MNAKTSVFAFAVLTLFAFGCGGGSGSIHEGGGSSSGATGIFRGAYNRASGTISIGIDDNKAVDVSIVDDAAGTFIGTGTLTGGSFTVTCNGTDNHVLTVTGTVSGSGAGAHVTGSTSGYFTTNFTANFSTAPSQQLFQHNYLGSFTGTESGILVGSVDATGVFIGSMYFDQEATIILDGTVSKTGYAQISGSSANNTFTLKGVLDPTDPSNVVINGIWSSPSRGNGSWTATESQDNLPIGVFQNPHF